MPRIDQETVNRILEAADIVEVVSDFVKLRRSGANYKGLCPFHNERTPSFSVNKARNICKCFSCGKGGSPVNFIMEHEQMNYQEALRYLARKYNIEIVEREVSDQERQAQSRREALMAVNQFALAQFEDNLRNSDEGRDIAMAYLRKRGVSEQMIARFHLGYAIDRGDDLLNKARAAGFDTDALVETGLEVEAEAKDGSKRLYDRFRGRIIFPIHSVAGRAVGFGGRTMRSDKNIAKYVNSPESAIYHKQLELYGFYQAKPAIGRRDKAILVEGYLDVISMHQAGVENVVASSGTSLTEGQIRAIRRFTRNVTIIYDADPAGIKASLRAINMLLAEEMNVKTLLLPEGDDPDSFAQSHSATEVEEYIAAHETDIIAFMSDILMRGVSPSDPTARARVVNTVLQSVAWVDEPVKRQEYISLVSRTFAIAEEVLVRQLAIFTRDRYEQARKEQEREEREASRPQASAGDTEQKENTHPESKTEKEESAPPAAVYDVNTLRPFERMILRYAVRYGFRRIARTTDADGNEADATVVDVISTEMALDEITFSHPPYARVFREIDDIYRNRWPADRARALEAINAEETDRLKGRRAEAAASGGSLAELEHADAAMVARMRADCERRITEFETAYLQQQLLNHPDDTVRATAGALVADRYTLSKIYSRQGNVEDEEDHLDTLVPRAINELRGAILRTILRDLNLRLAQTPADDTEAAAAIMEQILAYKEFQKRLVKALGDRIILPK